MRTLKIKEALAAKGIEAKEVETVKNGITCQGFQIETGERVKPVVYYSQGETIEAFVEKVVEIAKSPTPEVDVDNLITRDNLLNNSFICLQRQGTEQIVKRKYLNLESYVRLAITDFASVDSKASTKVTGKMLEITGVSEDELFEAARKNSLFKAQICTMAEALGLPEEMIGEAPFYVGSYNDRCHGAGVLALPECIHSFCQEHGFDQLILLPSSTEEILLVPTDAGNPEMFSEMVADVNATVVDKILRLEDCCYLFEDATQTITIASSKREEV